MGGVVSSVGRAVKSCFSAVGTVIKGVGKAIVSVAKGVGNFIVKHSKKILAAASIAAGIALCVCTGGLAAPIIGAGLIGGGLSAGALSFSKNASWKNFGKAFLGGFAAGALTTLAAPAITFLASSAGGLVTSTFASVAIKCAVSASLYAGIGVVSNGINNKLFGKKFFDNVGSAAICGGIIGCVSPFINGSGINQHVSNFFKPLERYFEVSLTTGAWAAVGGRALRMAGNFCISAITQKIATGKISLTKALFDSAIYGYVNHKISTTANQTGQPQMFTVDPTVPYTYNEVTQAHVPSTRSPQQVSQPQPAPARPQIRTGGSNSNNEASTPILTPTRTPSTTVPTSTQSNTTVTQSADEIITTAPSFIREPDSPTVTSSQATTFESSTNAEAQHSLLQNQASVIGEDTTSQNAILQALNRLHTVDSINSNDRVDSQPLIHSNSTMRELQNENIPTANVELPTKSHHQATNLEPQTLTSNTISQEADTAVSHDSTLTNQMRSSVPLEQLQTANDDIDIHRVGVSVVHVASQNDDTSELVSEIADSENIVNTQNVISTASGSNQSSFSQRNGSINIQSSNNISKTNPQSFNSPFISSITEEFRFLDALWKEKEEKRGASTASSNIHIFQNNVMDDERIRVGVEIQSRAPPPPVTFVGDSTLNVGNDESGMGYGQQLSNDQRIVEQPGTSNSSQSEPTPSSSSRTVEIQNAASDVDDNIPNDVKLIIAYPIVTLIEDEYKVLHWESWPKLPKNVKVVTVSGVHASGRTSFIHAMAYRLGYKMFKEQVVSSKVRIGVTMYIFPEKDFVILDCCDSMDAQNPDAISASSLILETFCHLISDHRIHHISIDESTFSTPQEYFDEYENRMKTLYGCGVKALPSGGGLQSTLLLRYDHLSAEQMESFKAWHDNWKAIKSILHEEVTSLETLDESTMNEVEKITAKNSLEKAFFNHDISLLSFLPESYSMNHLDLYKTQLDAMISLINDKTKPFQIEEDSENEDIRKLLCQAWYSVVTNEELKTDFSNVVNQVTTSSEGTEYDINGYIKNLAEFAENYNNESFGKEFENFLKNIGEEMKATKEKADPLIAFKLVLGSAEIFFKEGIRIGNIQHQNDLISLALEGFTLFLKGVEFSESYELASIRMSINDYKILEKFLNQPIVYENFDRCWHFLQYAAIYGYRLELIEYQIFPKIMKVVNKQSYSTEGERIAVKGFATIQFLLSLDTSKVFGEEPPPSEPEKFQLTQMQFVKTLGLFSKSVESKMAPLRTTRNLTIEEVQKRYEELLKLPEEFFDATEIAKKNGKTFADLDPRQSHFFATTLFRELYKSLAFFFADHVIENHPTFMSKESDSVQIVTAKIKVWKGVLHLCEESETLYKSILEKTNIKKWVMEMLKKPNSPYFIDALELANSILNGDYHTNIRKELAERISSNVVKQNHDLRGFAIPADIDSQERRQKLLLRYGDFCLNLIEDGHVSRILDIIFERRFEIPHKAAVFVSHIERLIHSGEFEEDKAQCLNIFINERHRIIKFLGQLFQKLSKLTLKNDAIEIRKSKRLMIASSYLMSELVYYFHATDHKNFYQSEEEIGKPLIECETWKNLMPICAVAVRDILQARKEDSDEDGNYGQRIVLSFIYNVSMTAEIPLAEIIAQAKSEFRIACQSDLDSGNWKDMILSEKSFIKIKPNENVNIRRCAYIYAKYVLPLIMHSKKDVQKRLPESFKKEFQFFKNLFKQHVNELSAEVEQKGQIEGWINAAEVREKFNENMNTKIVNGNDREIGHVTPASDFPSTSSARYYSNEFAIDDVKVFCAGHSYLDGIQVSYSNRKNELYEMLKEMYGTTIALALMFCIFNLQKRPSSVAKFLTLLQKIVENSNKFLQLKACNKVIEEILTLQYAREILRVVGYKEDENVMYLKATAETINSDDAQSILDFISEIKKDTVFEWKFCRSFKHVESNVPLQECQLPLAFFDDKKILTISKTAPIRILKQQQHQYSFAGFSLVRIKLQDGTFIQAVFQKSSTYNDIAKELDLFFLDAKRDPVYQICNENEEEISDMTKKLEELNHFYPVILLTLM